MYEKSSLHFLRTATGTQSVRDALEKPRAVITSTQSCELQGYLEVL